jgi:hypothetical protein
MLSLTLKGRRCGIIARVWIGKTLADRLGCTLTSKRQE